MRRHQKQLQRFKDDWAAIPVIDLGTDEAKTEEEETEPKRQRVVRATRPATAVPLTGRGNGTTDASTRGGAGSV